MADSPLRHVWLPAGEIMTVRPIANRHWRQANSLGEQPTKLNADVRFWPWRTSLIAPHMSAFGGTADRARLQHTKVPAGLSQRLGHLYLVLLVVVTTDTAERCAQSLKPLTKIQQH